jgi:hypothetical protein
MVFAEEQHHGLNNVILSCNAEKRREVLGLNVEQMNKEYRILKYK